MWYFQTLFIAFVCLQFSLDTELINAVTSKAKETDVKEGDDFILTCSKESYSVKECEFKTRKLVNDIKHEIYANGTLIIRKPNRTDAGVYNCAGSSWKVFVEIPVENNLIELKKTEGETVEIKFNSDNIARDSIQWFLNDNELDVGKDHRISVDGGKLVIINATKSDSGNYKCRIGEPHYYLIQVELVIEPKKTNKMTKICSDSKISWDPVRGVGTYYHVSVFQNSTIFEHITNGISIVIPHHYDKIKVEAKNKIGKFDILTRNESICSFQAYSLNTTSFLLRWVQPKIETKGYIISYQEHDVHNKKT